MVSAGVFRAVVKRVSSGSKKSMPPAPNCNWPGIRSLIKNSAVPPSRSPSVVLLAFDRVGSFQAYSTLTGESNCKRIRLSRSRLTRYSGSPLIKKAFQRGVVQSRQEPLVFRP